MGTFEIVDAAMNFTKQEKQFWQRHYHFDKPSSIPTDWQQLWSVDGNEDDDFFYYFTMRVSSITDVYLKDTLVSDASVKYMLKFKGLKNLFLRRHENITKASIPFFNQMETLENLNITKTGISLTDLTERLNNQSLKQVFLSSQDDEVDVEGKAILLKERMPNCDIYLDASHTVDVFGNPEKPIF